MNRSGWVIWQKSNFDDISSDSWMKITRDFGESRNHIIRRQKFLQNDPWKHLDKYIKTLYMPGVS